MKYKEKSTIECVCTLIRQAIDSGGSIFEVISINSCFIIFIAILTFLQVTGEGKVMSASTPTTGQTLIKAIG